MEISGDKRSPAVEEEEQYRRKQRTGQIQGTQCDVVFQCQQWTWPECCSLKQSHWS